MSESKPSIRWGIIATGGISTKFVQDLVLDRSDAPVTHIVQALGTSSEERGRAFIEKTFKGITPDKPRPKIYTDYAGVYADSDVDVVYIGTPHVFHKQNCLDAIAAGKHVLCEKPFTINAKESEEVIAAARAKNLFIMEAVWTRFFPFLRSLQNRLHTTNLLGPLHRLTCDFSIPMNLPSLPPSSRLRDRSLGAGALLDVGIYCLTQASMFLDPLAVGDAAQTPSVASRLVLNEDGIDVTDGVVLTYQRPGRMAVLSADLHSKSPAQFMRVEGERGSLEFEGPGAAIPKKVTVRKEREVDEVLEPGYPGGWMYFEADAVAVDILAGRKENAIMPLAETVRIMRLMDGIRKEGGVVYPQD